jgi:DNA-binding NarL/FixJ family response regulator
MASYSVLIADDHDIVRFGISSVIDLSPELNVQAEASNGEEAVNLYKNDHPDVVVLDLSMPKVNGIQTIRQLMEYDPHAKILVLTVHLEEGTLDQAIKFGALGYVLKDCNRSELVDAVTTVASGKRYFSMNDGTLLYPSEYTSFSREGVVLTNGDLIPFAISDASAETALESMVAPFTGRAD